MTHAFCWIIHVVRTWSGRGPSWSGLVCLKQTHGPDVVRTWSVMVRGENGTWSGHGPDMVRHGPGVVWEPRGWEFTSLLVFVKSYGFCTIFNDFVWFCLILFDFVWFLMICHYFYLICNRNHWFCLISYWYATEIIEFNQSDATDGFS